MGAGFEFVCFLFLGGDGQISEGVEETVFLLDTFEVALGLAATFPIFFQCCSFLVDLPLLGDFQDIGGKYFLLPFAGGGFPVFFTTVHCLNKSA